MTRKDYISKYKDAIIDSTKDTGLFPSLLMAQAILESSDSKGNAGESRLAKQYNNHFGVKADPSWKGNKVNLQTGEVFNAQKVTIGASFRVYNDPYQSFHDRNQFLLKNPRYRKAGVFTAKTPEEQAEALQQAGYATDPNYAVKLKSLINSLRLKELDVLAKKKESGSPSPLDQ